jgi:hypothetical protein
MRVQTKTSASTRRARIKTAITRVEKAETRSAKSRKRFAHYRYLRAVYRVYCELEDKRLLRLLRRYLIRNYRIRDEDAHAIRMIIDATTSRQEKRKRSRWTRALECAWNEEVSPDELLLFFRRNKGIAGCARLAARGLPKRRGQRTSFDDFSNVEEHDLPNPPRFEKEAVDSKKRRKRASPAPFPAFIEPNNQLSTRSPGQLDIKPPRRSSIAAPSALMLPAARRVPLADLLRRNKLRMS